jgi:hypothetical protein
MVFRTWNNIVSSLSAAELFNVNGMIVAITGGESGEQTSFVTLTAAV